MTEDEECVLGDMISFFNDMGWINESTQEAYDSLCEKYLSLIHISEPTRP